MRILVSGPPCAGKSAWARNLAEETATAIDRWWSRYTAHPSDETID